MITIQYVFLNQHFRRKTKVFLWHPCVNDHVKPLPKTSPWLSWVWTWTWYPGWSWTSFAHHHQDNPPLQAHWFLTAPAVPHFSLFLCLCSALSLACLLVHQFLLDNSLSSGLNVGVFSGKSSLIPSVLFGYLSSLLSWICVHILQHLSFPFKWFPLVVLFSPWKHHYLTHLWPYCLSQCFLS